MKIAFLVGTLGQGGAEKQLYLLASQLHQSGEDVCVFSITEGEFWEHKLKDIGVKVVNIGLATSRFYRLVKLYKLIKAYRPDIFYSFHFYTSSYVAIIGRLLGIFSIGSIRSNGNSKGKAAYLHFHLPHAIIANSKHGLANAQKNFLWKRKNVTLLANAINKPPMQKMGEKLKGEKFRILFVGRLEQPKRPLLFLKLVQIIHEQAYQNIEAIILGDGTLKAAMEAYCSSNHLEEIVTFKGNVLNVLEYMHHADMLLCTSEREGTPNVILEAMAMELPIVSANFDGAIDLLGKKSERGFVFNTEQELVEIVSSIQQVHPEKQIKEAKSFVSENYYIDTLLNRFFKAIKSLKS